MRRLLLAATLALAAGPSLADGFVIGPGRWSCADAVRIWGAEMTPPKGQLAGWILGYWTAESFRREKAFVDRVEAAGGLEVHVAETAFEAGLAMGRFQPDLILVSLNMPDLDAERMRHRLVDDDALRSVVVLACTSDREGSGRESILSTFDGLVEKPAELKPLLADIRQRLGQGRAILPPGAPRP